MGHVDHGKTTLTSSIVPVTAEQWNRVQADGPTGML
ncbi:hypothetical protein [Actinospica robiniae]